jgi:sarcosine oxidase subunit gamma
MMIPMAESPTRSSPVHDLLEQLHPRWGALDGMPVPLSLGGRSVPQEQGLARTLALCDVSALHRLVLKGPAAASFLEARAIAPTLPAEVFRVLPLRSGGLIARTGRAEFFLEDAPGAGGTQDVVAPLAESLLDSPQPDVYPALPQDASFLLSGDRASAVFRETCGYDFDQAGLRACPNSDPARLLVMTRVAGVSTWVLHRTLNGNAAYQLWADGTYGPHLWETLLKLARERSGDAVGLSVFFPEV